MTIELRIRKTEDGYRILNTPFQLKPYERAGVKGYDIHDDRKWHSIVGSVFSQPEAIEHVKQILKEERA